LTTIAYRDGIMAADSACLAENTHEHDIRKIFRVGGALIGCCGSVYVIERFKAWLKAGADPEAKPSIRDGFEAVIVRASGKIFTFDSYGEHAIEALTTYVAIGNGAEIALGAMFAGADARKAVQAAVKHNALTKGPVRCYKLNKH
jgi:hypothetical protein